MTTIDHPASQKPAAAATLPTANDLPQIQQIVDKLKSATPLYRDSPGEALAKLAALLNTISCDVPDDTFISIVKAVHHTVDGNGDDGIELLYHWCIKAGIPRIRPKIETVWNSIAPTPTGSGSNPLDQYSLRGMAPEIERQAIEAAPVLGDLALMGQSTVWYAAPNTGKTLIAIALLIEGITSSRINPSCVYYINVDDNGSGLAEKLHTADEYNFHMLAEGYRDFTVSAFLHKVKELIETDKSSGVIIVLDTLKRFVDLMDKKKSSGFTHVIRRFVQNGGTVIALAHTNKNPGRDGKPVYGGVSDIVADFDCAYILKPIPPAAGADEKVVEFENIKRRGNVAQHAAFKYSIDNDISYNEILASVKPIDEMQIEPIKQAAQIRSDADVIDAVEESIRDGINSKMKLADAVAKRVEVSKRQAIQIIEKYTGNDPALHRWSFDVRARGAKVFVLLDQTTPDASSGSTA